MQIQLNTDNQIVGSEALTRHVEEIVHGAIGRFSSRITRVEVHLTDQNSSRKAGDDDKRCVMEARLAGLQPITVSDQAATIDQALDGAADKLEQALSRALGRLNDTRS